jgi:hypothetical protein
MSTILRQASRGATQVDASGLTMDCLAATLVA